MGEDRWTWTDWNYKSGVKSKRLRKSWGHDFEAIQTPPQKTCFVNRYILLASFAPMTDLP
jgi:hypothetical protein